MAIEKKGLGGQQQFNIRENDWFRPFWECDICADDSKELGVWGYVDIVARGDSKFNASSQETGENSVNASVPLHRENELLDGNLGIPISL